MQGVGAIGGAIGEACTLGLARVRRLWARVEGVCAGSRATTRDLGERGACLVVWDIRLARIGKERQDGSDALRRCSATCGDGDEESSTWLGLHTHPP